MPLEDRSLHHARPGGFWRPRVEWVTAVVRRPPGNTGGKICEVVCPDMFEIATIAIICASLMPAFFGPASARLVWPRLTTGTDSRQRKAARCGRGLEGLQRTRSRDWASPASRCSGLSGGETCRGEVRDRYGRAMIAAVQPGVPTAICETADINRMERN